MEPNQCITANVNSLRPGAIAMRAVCLVFMSTLASVAPQAAPNVKAQVQANYGRLPLSFEVNRGQTDAQVKFLARGQGYALFLTSTEAVLNLKKSPTQAKTSSSAESSSSPEATGAVLRMQFVGANHAPRVVGKETLTGRVNYLIGKDSAKWHTKVPTYGKVVYEGLYPGVDLVYYGNQGQLEYDFMVAPGADPGRVKLAFRGADKIEVNPAGELVLHTAGGDVRMHKPVIYQELDGVRRPVNGGYELKDGQTVGFQVAAYDASHPLVIDPVLIYSTYLGGSGSDTGFGIAVDKQGQAYVTGQTNSSDFPIVNELQTTLNGSSDVFVTQFTADGSAVGYSTYLGGNDDEGGSNIAVDKKGQAYVTGQTSSSDFPTVNALQPALNGFSDAFVVQLTADGSALRYATYLGGSGNDGGGDISVDKKDQAYVAGQTNSSDFPIVNAFQPTSGGQIDAFVVKFTADGSALRYATYLGGERDDSGTGISVDQQGQAYVTGFTDSSNFPTVNAFQPDFSGNTDDAFVVKFTANGSALRYATYLGGSREDIGTDIAVDKKGQAYVTGVTTSLNFPTVNALKPAFDGHTDAFVAKFAADGSALRYATYLGGGGFEVGNGIAVDQQGQAYVTGWTELSDFPIVNAFQPTSGGQVDAFIVKFTADGAAFRYASHLGGGAGDLGLGIALDKWNQAYVTGGTASGNFPIVNALQPISNRDSPFNAFVTKIGSDNRSCEHEKKCKDLNKDRDDHDKIHEDHGKNWQREHGSKLTLRDHLDILCQSRLKVFTCRLSR